MKRILILLISSLLLLAGSALAHGDEEGAADAADLSQQAIAFLRAEPANLMEAEERLNDALQAEDPSTVSDVNLNLVAAALTAVKEGATTESIRLLDRALGQEAEPLGAVVEVRLGTNVYLAFAIGLVLVGLGAYGLGRRAGSASLHATRRAA